MEHYEVEEGTGCHIFPECGSYEELLDAIKAWWGGIQAEAKLIQSIVFTEDADDRTVGAEVNWSWLTPEKKEQLVAVMESPRDLPPVEKVSEN